MDELLAPSSTHSYLERTEQQFTTPHRPLTRTILPSAHSVGVQRRAVTPTTEFKDAHASL
ncbi:hypothetical protein KDK95_30430 [Actinospica sp. MGRD01-02]|uniref:Uncharacterized protein n=1 Tax=Actinospica acidithermotolerans TaxID=2828514 RepID=A0A941EHT1_9ACTN|nr:hypothetical protein [Actinospica acidithermotolerans]MBR7830658.1 hypothetical protein [Actinospica acidithermotolerans]